MNGFLQDVTGRFRLLPSVLLSAGTLAIVKAVYDVLTEPWEGATPTGRSIAMFVAGVVLLALGIAASVRRSRRRAADERARAARRAAATTTGTTASHGASNTLPQWGTAPTAVPTPGAAAPGAGPVAGRGAPHAAPTGWPQRPEDTQPHAGGTPTPDAPPRSWS